MTQFDLLNQSKAVPIKHFSYATDEWNEDVQKVQTNTTVIDVGINV